MEMQIDGRSSGASNRDRSVHDRPATGIFSYVAEDDIGTHIVHNALDGERTNIVGRNMYIDLYLPSVMHPASQMEISLFIQMRVR